MIQDDTFTWVFVIQEVHSRMMGAQAAGGIWRWFVYPAQSSLVSWGVPLESGVAPSLDSDSLALAMVTDEAE